MDASPAIILRRRKVVVMGQKMTYCSECGFGHWVRECPTCGHEEGKPKKQTPPDMDIAVLGPKYAVEAKGTVFLLNGQHLATMVIEPKLKLIRVMVPNKRTGKRQEVCFDQLQFWRGNGTICNGYRGTDRNIFVAEIPDEQFLELQVPLPTKQNGKTVSISIDTASILKALLLWFKGAIKAGKIADPENYTDRLTVEYCDELTKELSNDE